MAHSPDEVKLRATDILVSVVNNDPAPLRMFLLGQKGDDTLFSRLVGEFVGPSDNGLPEQIAELLKQLLDPESMENVGGAAAAAAAAAACLVLSFATTCCLLLVRLS